LAFHVSFGEPVELERGDDEFKLGLHVADEVDVISFEAQEVIGRVVHFVVVHVEPLGEEFSLDPFTKPILFDFLDFAVTFLGVFGGLPLFSVGVLAVGNLLDFRGELLAVSN